MSDLEELMSKEQMEAAVKVTMQVNEGEFQEDDEHRIMIDVTRGLLSIYEEVVGTHKGLNTFLLRYRSIWMILTAVFWMTCSPGHRTRLRTAGSPVKKK